MSPKDKTDRYSVQTEDSLPPPDLPSADKIYQGRAPMIPRKNGMPDLKNGNLTVGAFTLTGIGLQISGKATQEDWSRLGEMLFKLEGSIQWLIGDWINYGEDFGYGDVKKFAEEMGREPGTFWDYAYISRQIETSIRIEVLSFGHHRLVAPLTPEQQVYSLQHAADNKLSVAAFRTWIREQKGEQPQPALPDPDEAALKPLASQFKKLMRQDRTQAEDYLNRVERWAADMRAQLRGQG